MGHDSGVKLTKPALRQNLDYLEKGLEGMPSMSYTLDKWGPGWIPQEVKTIVTGVAGIHYNPEDFLVYNVHYKDCGDPWVFGYHKKSTISIDSMAHQFGRLPIQMRQWVRHVITVPADNGWAFEWNGSITFIKPGDNMMTVIAHETGHSLDLNGAYPDHPISSSDNWWNNYNQDANVPDPYAQTNAVEDVAQNTVLAVFNENVHGGFGSVEPEWNKVFHQYATLITGANAKGQGSSIFRQGESGTATHRLPSSPAVPMSNANAQDNAKKFGNPPVTHLRTNVKLVDTSHRVEKGTEHSGCGLKW